MNNKIKDAVNTAQRAQRNYDLSKSIPQEDLDTLIHVATNSPSKQNETHYALHVYTDQHKIREIYNQTKFFSLIKDETDFDNVFKEENGEFWQSEDLSVHNSQILSNALFVYSVDHGRARGGNSNIAQTTSDTNTESVKIYNEQIDFSIGISVGQLILSATILGYKTGLCSAFPKPQVRAIINSKYNVKLLVGIGFENTGVDRKLHAETLNKELPTKFQNGEPNEKWKFPSFEKNIKVIINGS
jgi:nitroreductase